MVEPARPPEHASAAAPARVPGHPPEDAAAAAPVPVPGHPVEHASAAAPVPVPGRPPDEPAFALLIDGTAVRIRQIGPGDLAAVRDLHRGMSPDNLYLRFFGLSPRLADETFEHLCREPGPDHAVLGAWLGEDLIGVANYEPAGVPGAAEIALAVADAMHHRGVGTLLLEHASSRRHPVPAVRSPAAGEVAEVANQTVRPAGIVVTGPPSTIIRIGGCADRRSPTRTPR